ncbi:hypothetical protein F4680DRAFT_155129 [Xylaria scruposa]|nr:hypothetical protein F4680DRAFT_155129 [Xylaria scruposa]
MSLRRVWTRAPHTTRTAMSQSWSRPTHLRVQISYRDALLGSQKEKQQHSSKVYSNYAPKGPSQYYGAYGQPPKSRASRLKDMAIGSALTIAIFLAYILYYNSQRLLQEKKEAEEVVKRANISREMHKEIYSRYQKRKAEIDDDSSSESSKETNQERRLIIIYAQDPDGGDTFEAECLGSLSRFPEGHEKQGSEMVKDGEALVFLLLLDDAEERVITHLVIISIDCTAENLGISNPISASNDQTYPKFDEIKLRAAMMIHDMFHRGTLDFHRPILLDFQFLDGQRTYVWDPFALGFVHID